MKLHVSMKVPEIEEAKTFYSALFGQAPTVERDGYAKWDVADPPVNFVIEHRDGEAGLDHLGIQAENSDQLETLAGRMRGMGRPFLDVEKTTCCYAKMEKAWIKGDAEDKWEAFLTHSHDATEYGEDRDHLLDPS